MDGLERERERERADLAIFILICHRPSACKFHKRHLYTNATECLGCNTIVSCVFDIKITEERLLYRG